MYKLIAVLLVSLIATTVCAQTQKEAAESPIVTGNNKLALSLYDQLRNQEKGNLFFSPYSISTALSMTYAGARGETQSQMAKVLCFPSSSADANEKFHADFGQLIKDINARGSKGAYELTVANALWEQKGYPFLKDYLSLMETNYEGGFNQVDFIHATEEARQTINKWVEKKTKDKIKDLIEPGILSDMTRLVLTDAIYFKGKWATQFQKDQTKNDAFTLQNGQKIDVPMMKQTATCRYRDTNDMQVLELAYLNNELSMIILLPKKSDGLQDLEKKLILKNISQWLHKMRKMEVDVAIPRFTMTQQFLLNETLQSMGMTKAFSMAQIFPEWMEKKFYLFPQLFTRHLLI